MAQSDLDIKSKVAISFGLLLHVLGVMCGSELQDILKRRTLMCGSENILDIKIELGLYL